MLSGIWTFTVKESIKLSKWSHEHVTLHFRPNGEIAALSRDKSNSVGKSWEVVGCHGSWNCGDDAYVVFFASCEAFDFAATAMLQSKMVAREHIEGARIQDIPMESLFCGYQDRKNLPTSPEGCRGLPRNRHPGNPRDKRRDVQKKFGSIGTCDVAAMRRAIENK